MSYPAAFPANTDTEQSIKNPKIRHLNHFANFLKEEINERPKVKEFAVFSPFQTPDFVRGGIRLDSARLSDLNLPTSGSLSVTITCLSKEADVYKALIYVSKLAELAESLTNQFAKKHNLSYNSNLGFNKLNEAVLSVSFTDLSE